MKKKGFTLIELLAVLIVLGIVMTMVIVSVNSVITNSEHSLSGIQKSKVEDAAKVYYLKEGDMTKTSACVNLQALVNKGYLEGSTVSDPETGLTMTGSVAIVYSGNQYEYTYQDNSCSNVTCSFEDTDEDGDYTLGDKVDCEGENFYVISSDTNTVRMLARKNIEIKTENSKQSSSAGTTNFASSEYWWDDTKSEYLSAYDNNSETPPPGYPDTRYVYDNKSNLKIYLDAYKNYLKSLGFDANLDLLKTEDAVTVCGQDVFSQGTCDHPLLLKDSDQNYWTGVATIDDTDSNIAPYMVYVNYQNIFSFALANNSSNIGIRPVVNINKSYIPIN